MELQFDNVEQNKLDITKEAWTQDGLHINSGFLNGLDKEHLEFLIKAITAASVPLAEKVEGATEIKALEIDGQKVICGKKTHLNKRVAL